MLKPTALFDAYTTILYHDEPEGVATGAMHVFLDGIELIGTEDAFRPHPFECIGAFFDQLIASIKLDLADLHVTRYEISESKSVLDGDGHVWGSDRSGLVHSILADFITGDIPEDAHITAIERIDKTIDRTYASMDKVLMLHESAYRHSHLNWPAFEATSEPATDEGDDAFCAQCNTYMGRGSNPGELCTLCRGAENGTFSA